MDDLDAIWDAPVTPPAAAKEPLFLADDEDDQMPDAPPRRTLPTPDLTALFSAVDAIPDDPSEDGAHPALTPHQILSSSPAHHLDDKDEGNNDDKGAKKPKKVLRLDEGRLIDCFPQLIEDSKNIKIKGKGHEASDLNRLLQVYQFWTHRLYPKTPFKDTVDRVEKLCHSKRMHNQLSQWRDEAHGITRENAEDDEEDRALVDLTDHSNPAPDSDQADYASSSSHEATRPPSSVDGDDDADMVAAMDAAAKLNAQQSSINRAPDDEDIQAAAKARTQAPVDDDDEFWDVVDAVNGAAVPSMPVPSMPVPKHALEDDLDEDWDAVDAMNGAAAIPTPVPQHTPKDDLDEEEWDALDAMAVDSAGR
ncbi:replication fork protection component Swi3-domain-containing protein [Mycena albidolilacea]|uniref:Chromosome segregation in meiosis protein n=1 Tax=Mycena albidolilacea TaxID=1033008 RepID=A0AAD6ZXE7_9AGAR|nr:replication fork protection component Swi3-domain-containing protein [Mycena albidolilacea]